jgi:zinc-binding alcohol dehydrogenase family protein
MRAVGFFAPFPALHPESLLDLELPAPVPGPRDLLVRVRAVSVNPVDVKVRASARPPEGQARVLGFDAAGVVEAVGDEVVHFRPGDEVYYAGAIDRPGSNAELQVVDERIVGRKPQRLDFADAASLPLTAITAWELLLGRLGVRPEDAGALLVVNGAGGVGSILIQLARKLTGLTVIATASRPESREWAVRMGAHHVIDHSRPLDAELRALGRPQVELIAGLTGSEMHRQAFVEAIAPQGRIALIDDPSSFDIVPFKRKSVTLAWELMFTRSLYRTADLIEQHHLLDQVSELVDRGTLLPTTGERLGPVSAATLRQAHHRIESGRTIGKIVLGG